MKRKKLLVTLLCLGLVAALSVGATLAFLQASDTKVVNTFSLGEIEVSILEKDLTTIYGSETAIVGADKKTIDYSNLVPGQKIEKNPYATINTSVPAYIFINISGLSATVISVDVTQITANGWTAVSGQTDAAGNGVYYRQATAADKDTQFSIFESVTLGENVTDSDLNNLKVQIGVYAIQSQAITLAEATVQAQTYFAANN